MATNFVHILIAFVSAYFSTLLIALSRTNKTMNNQSQEHKTNAMSSGTDGTRNFYTNLYVMVMVKLSISLIYIGILDCKDTF